MSSPVSANMTRNTPNVPRLVSSEVVLSGLSAVIMGPCSTRTGQRRTDGGPVHTGYQRFAAG